MTNTIRTLVTLLLSATTHVASAHPGPHAHINIDSTAPHADLGWPALLVVGVVIATVIIWRRRARQH